MLKNLFALNLLITVLLFNSPIVAQEIANDVIKQRIQDYKEDPRGPFAIIKWF